MNHLDVGYCSFLTDVSLLALTTHCIQLHTLKIDKCTLMKDEGICFVVEQLPNLSTLDIAFCELLTDKSAHLILSNKTLIDVNVNNVDNMSSYLKDEIARKFDQRS